jgi:8-oxo-dGTP pyrophosphatase MutT (NUDIX family)
MAFIDRIHEANGINLSEYLPFVVDQQVVGRVPKSNISELAQLDTLVIGERSVSLQPALASMGLIQRSQQFNKALKALQAQGSTIMHQKWWGENYRADTGWNSEAKLLIERAAAKTFGVNGYGVHLNGYVKKADGIHLWVATRAANKPTAPGQLDQMVAGGLPAGLQPREAMIKEAQEEANLENDLCAKIISTSYISYTKTSQYGSRSDNLFIYDLQLPVKFRPKNTDGEVEKFELMPIKQVMDIVANTTEFKFNCSLVIIDFFIRHGLITPEHKDYEAICSGLRQKLPL